MKYDFNGNLYEWVRMDGGEDYSQDFDWYTDFNNKKAVFVDFGEDNWTFDENNLLASTYVMQNKVIREHKVYHSHYGAYVKHKGKRYYVLVTLG